MPTSGIDQEIAPAELQTLIPGEQPVQIIDVRTPLEFDTEHIKDSVNIPLDELGRRGSEIKKDMTTVLVCRSGKRAGMAAQTLAPYGFESRVLTGGILGWRKAGLPVIEGKKRLSLERQVQLTIGLILLTSVTLGYTISNLFFILAGFIGAGLTFAGLSGTCGLAILISKAPWNRLETTSKTGAGADSPKSCCS
ncbi:MAG: rhodanese-like domain-containing protein [Cyanobacteria bacterium HKST-UBA02]|nr:rhodanese-like domain-containing protein [Cyanobacteria bacterium HKST-UBA02]